MWRLARNADLVMLGRYIKDNLGRHIELYYGSFRHQFPAMTKARLKERIRETILHEFEHHVENLAGNRDLEAEDAAFITQYRGERPER